MNSEGFQAEAPSTLNVVTWNILIDMTRTKKGLMRSQSDRLPSLIETLKIVRGKLGGELDAVAIQEAHKKDGQHNGEELARALGYKAGQWVEHNQKPYPTSKRGRTGEYAGLFGAQIDDHSPIELGDNRRAIMSRIGEVSLVNIHTRADKTGVLQNQQVGVALDHIAHNPLAMFVGDFNRHLSSRARQAIESEGFESVFTASGLPQPKTWPTPDYRRAMYGPIGRYIIPSVVFDDIYVRGLETELAFPFIGDTDHVGLAARVKLPNIDKT